MINFSGIEVIETSLYKEDMGPLVPNKENFGLGKDLAMYIREDCLERLGNDAKNYLRSRDDLRQKLTADLSPNKPAVKMISIWLADLGWEPEGIDTSHKFTAPTIEEEEIIEEDTLDFGEDIPVYDEDEDAEPVPAPRIVVQETVEPKRVERVETPSSNATKALLPLIKASEPDKLKKALFGYLSSLSEDERGRILMGVATYMPEEGEN